MLAAKIPVAEPERTLAAIPFLAALASPDRVAQLQRIATKFENLEGVPADEIAARHGGQLILLEQGCAGWDQALLNLAVDQPSSAVIVISDHIPAHMFRALMKLSASDVLPSSATVQDISDAAAGLERVAEVEKSHAKSICWAFKGAVGGAGVSTIAIEAAFELGRMAGPGKVCLVDLNLADGMITSFLETVPKLDLGALSAAPERLDARLLAAWCSQHERDLTILAAPRNADNDALATEAAILRLLDVTCGAFDYVLLDMPRHMMPWTKSVMSAVDEAIIVSELTVPSLHAAADMCRDVDLLRGDRPRAKLVLNRMFQKKRLRSEFALDKAEAAIERKIDATVTSDWDAARTAVNLGRPIAEVKPRSPLVADVGTLVRSFLPQGVPVAAPVQQKRRRRG